MTFVNAIKNNFFIKTIFRYSLGAFLVAFLASLANAAAPIAFQLINVPESGCTPQCPQIMVADGEIDEEAAPRFAAFFKAAQEQYRQNPALLRRVLYLSSLGGNVLAATELGMLLRRAKITVVIAQVYNVAGHPFAIEGRCLSACIYAMMGGQKRIVPAKAQLGIHCMFARTFIHDPSNKTEQLYEFATPEMVADLRAYSKRMGINPQLISLAQRIGPNDMRYLTPQEMLNWQLGERPSGALSLLR